MINENKPGKKYDFASLDILLYIWEKKLPLAVITVIAGIISIILSFTITPKFKSSLVIYPTSNGLYVTLDEEAQVEQLLQVIISEEVKNRVVAKNNLMKHYDIDPNSEYPLTYLDNIYNSNIKVRKTEYGSIQLDVLDKDPQMAADIANDISQATDTVYNNILKKRARSVLQIVEREWFDFLNDYNELKDSLSEIRSLGVYDNIDQASRYNQSYAGAMLRDGVKTGKSNKAFKIMDDKFGVLSRNQGEYEVLYYQLLVLTDQYDRLKERYRQAKTDTEQTFPHQLIVNSAFKADKKTYPRKAIIIVVSTFSAFLLSLMLLMISDNFKKRLR